MATKLSETLFSYISEDGRNDREKLIKYSISLLNDEQFIVFAMYVLDCDYDVASSTVNKPDLLNIIQTEGIIIDVFEELLKIMTHGQVVKLSKFLGVEENYYDED